MDRTTLVDKQIQEGKFLLSELDKKKLDVKAAFWIYDEADSSWKLILASASKKLDVKTSPLEAYTYLTEIMRSMPDISLLSPSDVVLISFDHPFIENMGPLIKTGSGIADLSISNSLLNKLYVENMHLYRMDIQF